MSGQASYAHHTSGNAFDRWSRLRQEVIALHDAASARWDKEEDERTRINIGGEIYAYAHIIDRMKLLDSAMWYNAHQYLTEPTDPTDSADPTDQDRPTSKDPSQ